MLYHVLPCFATDEEKNEMQRLEEKARALAEEAVRDAPKPDKGILFVRYVFGGYTFVGCLSVGPGAGRLVRGLLLRSYWQIFARYPGVMPLPQLFP